MENTNDSKFDDDFNCEGGIIWGKSTPSSLINKKKYDVSNEEEEDEIYYEPYFDSEQEIPDGYEWESYTEIH
ncbi:hypothetical protein LGK97_13990 [Clostridium sp. CS001]|uniref:hypothetical protein n=1 Tax=Clostridium sp. CS001 TaxID=2880648 RepID=UPI001CF2260F|nr:hypothetical protein [Clostridium sp. CS001]MCB2290853.1 hypothetical protein [Clostridium sp. CS001]